MDSSVEDGIVDDVIDDVLEHFGMKGMHWGRRKGYVTKKTFKKAGKNSLYAPGTRRDTGHIGDKVSNRKIRRLDKKFEKPSVKKDRGFHNRAAALANKNIKAINDQPKYRGKDFRKDTPLRQQYMEEHKKNFMSALNTAAREAGTNASGTRKYQAFDKGDGWDIRIVDVKHAVIPVIDPEIDGFEVLIERDSLGHITKLSIQTTSVQHGETVVSQILEHHGVKGMHWGVRTGRGGLSKSQFKKKIAKGRKDRKKKKVNVKSMTDNQLREAINRMNMEKQLTSLNKSTRRDQQAKTFITDIGKNSVKNAVTAEATKQVAAGLAVGVGIATKHIVKRRSK